MTAKTYNLTVVSILLAILQFPSAFTQTKSVTTSIHGVVLNRTTHAPITNANIVLLGTDAGAATDLNGEFIVPSLKPGTYNVSASALGYLPVIASDVNLKPGRTVEIEILLEPTVIQGSDVVVHGGFFRLDPDLPTSSRTLAFEEIRRQPGSAEDVQRAIQALPGVANSNDQNNEIIVRGGSPSENLLIIDGIEIDNMNHFPDQSTSGGPIGLVNPEFLDDVTFASGGFSARYGDRLSSVLDIDLREGNRERFRSELELSMAGVGANSEGGMLNGKGSYLISYRKSFLDLVQGAVGLTAIPRYWDVQGKFVYDLRPLDELSLVALHGDDKISIEAEEEDAWTRGAEAVDHVGHTTGLGVNYRKIWRAGYSEFTIGTVETYYNQQAFEVVVDSVSGERTKRKFYDNLSTERNNQFHANWSSEVRTTDEFSFGFSLKPLDFSHERWLEQDTAVYDLTGDDIPDTVFREELQVNVSTTSLKYAGHLQYRWKPMARMTLNGGVRLDGFQYNDRATIAPRISFNYNFSPQWSTNFASGIYYQAQPLVVLTSGPKGENANLPYQRADQYIGGVTFLPRESTKISFEAYYKDYRNLIESETILMRSSDPSFRSWRYLAVGRKYAWGLEAFMQQKLIGDWFGTLSYSYGEATYNNSQQTMPSDYDYRHIATLVYGYKMSGYQVQKFQQNWYGWWTYVLPLNGDELTASTRLRYVSGRPYTSRIWTRDGIEYNLHWEESEILNNERYPAYTRWDLRWDSRWFTGIRSVVVFMEVQNVLNRANLAEYIYADDGEIDDVYQFRFFFVGGIRLEL